MKLSLPIWLKDYRFFQIFALAVISAMPLGIIFTTIGAWLKDLDTPISVITTIAVARIPYSLKVFWSPIVDRFKIPLLSKFGRRKSWMILSTSLIIIILFAISETNPKEHLDHLKYLAIALGILSATYDITYDAFRIEILSDNEQAFGAATVSFGYRLGIMITSGGALYLAGMTGDNWQYVFQILAAIFLCGLVFIMTVRDSYDLKTTELRSLFDRINDSAIIPLRDILSRKSSVAILASIVLYKMGEAMLGIVSTPFYMELGYTKMQIGLIVKGYGALALILGAYAGGFLIYKLGNIKGMIICGLAQSIANFIYIWLHYQPVADSSLLVTIFCDNFTGGMGNAALISYLSILCNKQYTATQYALLSSLAPLINTTFSSYSGTLVEYFGWDYFFALTVFLEIPALLLLMYLGRVAGVLAPDKST